MLRFLLGLLVVVSLAGCERRSGEAIVLAKEYIAAAAPTPGTASAHDASTPASGEAEVREIQDDEIAVGGYVMKSDVRGTGRDPRALKDEQWRVEVRTVSDGRRFTLQTDQSHFDKLKDGDRVWVSYRVGKYTRTVWAAELQDSKK